MRFGGQIYSRLNMNTSYQKCWVIVASLLSSAYCRKCMLFFSLSRVLTSKENSDEAASITNISHPPVPTASWPALPSNFSDLPSNSQECWNSRFSFSFTTYFLWTEASKSITPVVTTFNPPQTYNRTYTFTQQTDCTTTNFGLTTLCDGVPRAESRSSQCRTTQFVTSDVWVQSSSTVSYITASWTSQFKPAEPTCKVAPDGSLLCNRMYEAWSYRSSQIQSEKTLDSKYLGTLYNMIAPHCVRTYSTETTYTGTMCRLIAPTYSAYYWPTPAPSGSEFCQSTRPAPTITANPSTTVVSGHTLTSPSVYHFLRDVRIETYLFDQQRYNLSVALPSDQVLTVAQLESDILSASITCRGREADYCTASFTPDFRVNDIFIARVNAYKRNCGCEADTIYQSNYKPTLAVSISDIVNQNPNLGGKLCDWDLYAGYSGDWNGGVESSIPAVVFEDVPRTKFLPITTKTGDVVSTTGPVPGGVVESTPTPTSSIV
jgi:hypothetical protein